MAKRSQQKDLITTLLDRGEQAIGRITDLPSRKNVVETLNAMRDRVDDLQKRVRGIVELEQRIAALEKRVDELAGKKAKPAAARKSSAQTRKAAPGRKASGGSSRSATPKTGS